MIKAYDPDRLRYKFWERNKWFAPKQFHHEDDWTHYTYVEGFHSSKVGPNIDQALRTLWGKQVFERRSLTEYKKYMDDKMDEPLVWANIDKLNWCQQVYGDCTLENIVMTNRLEVKFIDPGYPRGLVCIENDLAKLLQSKRGWERVKAGQPIERTPFVEARAIVAIYITHLYRLLRHPHSDACLQWAREEIDLAKDYLDN